MNVIISFLGIAPLLNSLPGAVSQGLIWGIMAIGVYITYKVLDIADLTVDGSLCTGAAVCIVMLTNGHSMWLSLLCATLAGMLAGMATGLLHTFMGIPPILAGILTQFSLYSVNLMIMGKANLAVNPNKYSLLVTMRNLTDTIFYKHPIIVLSVIIIILILFLYWLFGTEIGSSLRATGCNQTMARAQGINVSFNKVLGLMISNGLVALSGALLAQYQGFADINMGRGAIVIGLASVVIGEAILGRFFQNFGLHLLAAALGGAIYYIVLQTVIFLGFDTDTFKLLSAIIIALFLAFPHWKGKYFSKPIRKVGKKNVANK